MNKVRQYNSSYSSYRVPNLVVWIIPLVTIILLAQSHSESTESTDNFTSSYSWGNDFSIEPHKKMIHLKKELKNNKIKHNAGDPFDSAYNYVGRVDFSNSKGPAMYYAGSYIHTRFKGRSLKAVFSDDKSKIPLRLMFILDDTIIIKKELQLGAESDTLYIIEGLTDSIHDLYISKTDGPGAGAYGLCFNGLILDDNSQIYKPDIPNLRIEIFGDSFTEGVGSECKGDGDCGKNNGWFSYANRMAREVGAVLYNNGIGGLAVMDSTGWYQNKTTGLQTTYNKLIPTNENGLQYKEWDFRSFIPDIVILAMGVNDEYDPYTRAFKDTALWKDTYKKIILNLLEDYGAGTRIIIAPGNLRAEKAYIFSESIVEELKHDGYAAWFFRYSFELDAHPDSYEHIRMAHELADFIMKERITIL